MSWSSLRRPEEGAEAEHGDKWEGDEDGAKGEDWEDDVASEEIALEV